MPKEDITVIVGPGAGTQNLDANAGPTVPCPYTFGEYTTRKYYNGDGSYTVADGYYVGENIYMPGNPSFEYEDVVFPNGKGGRETYSLYVGTYDCGPVWFMMFLYN